MKSDTRYSHIVKYEAKSGKTMDGGVNRQLEEYLLLHYPVSGIVPAVYAH